jgi:hypothetical protein
LKQVAFSIVLLLAGLLLVAPAGAQPPPAPSPQVIPEWLPEPGVDHFFEQAVRQPQEIIDAPVESILPIPEGMPIGDDPLSLSPVADGCLNCAPRRHGRKGPWPSGADEPGIGSERVGFAIFELDPTQPLNNFRLRFDAAYNLERPDRAEFYWAKIGGKGPKLPERSVNYQDVRMYWEIGGAAFSTFTELPIRVLDPEVNLNTASLGDMTIGTKLRLLDEGRWQMTQVMRTFMQTGLAKRGLGNGHVSMEPGLLFRYQYSPETYLHSELKYWFPIGGDPDYSGQVLRYGFGWSHVAYDNDDIAIMPTLEVVGWAVLDGLETDPFGLPVAIDPEAILNIYPGVRLFLSEECPFGKFEAGFSGGVTLTRNHWYEGLLRLDLRWSW